MDGFILPTQLALLVYDYLLEEGCPSAAESFIESSQHTKEARQYYKKGGFVFRVLDLRLPDIIEILGEVVVYVKSLECSQSITKEEIIRQLRLILRLSSDRENAQKPVYLRFTMEQSLPRKSPRKNKPSETNSSPKSCKSLPETTSPKADGSVIMPSNSKFQQHFHVLLENKVLHEKLAENINKVVANKNESLETMLQEKIIGTIYNRTEQDPFFQDMLEELIGPVEASNTPEDTEHENDDIGTSDIRTPNDGVEADSGLQMQWQELPLQTTAVGENSQLVTSAGVQTPNAGNIADKAVDKPAVSYAVHPSSPASGPVVTQPLTPHVANPSVAPVDIQTVLATSSTCIPVTTQGSAAYAIASSPGTSVLNSLVTPSIVIGSTFSGAAVKFTPTGPTTSWIRQVQPPQHISSTPPRMLSQIKVLPRTTLVSSLKAVLPKQPPQTISGGVVGQPIFQVPVTHQGSLQSGGLSLQNNVATVSLATPASPVASQSVPPIVKMGVRTRGGKVKSYPGRKKIVQTIGPSTQISPETPGASKTMQSENKVDVVDHKKSSERPVEIPLEETVETASSDTLTTGYAEGSSANDTTKNAISESRSPHVPDSFEETEQKPEAEVANPDAGIPTSVAEVAQPDAEIPKSVEETAKSGNEVTNSNAELMTTSAQQAASQENFDPVVTQPEADPVESSSSGTNSVPCRTDATPQQGSEPRVKLRKRLSLSTPRRGSHVRTLEFKTPPKNSIGPRKSLSSPKNKAPETRKPEMQRMLESVKKSELFKSPPKKEKKAWDADLRHYTTEEDIPTSVGLKRKCSTTKRTGSASKNKGSKNASKCASADSKSDEDPPASVVDAAESTTKSPEKGEAIPKTPDKKSESEEDLVSRIQREVLDVIDEEDVADLSSTNLCADKSAGNIGESPKSSPKLLKSPIISPGTSSVLEIGDIGLSASTIKKLYQRATSVDESSCTMDSPLSKAPKDNLLPSPKQSRIEASKENLFASPIRTAIECAKYSTPTLELQLQLSPSPRQLKTDLGSTPPPNKSGIISDLSRTPGSGSLEGVLIRECRRIEKDRVETARESRIGATADGTAPKALGISDADVSASVIRSDAEGKTVAETAENSAVPLNHLLPPIGITPLKTPGKTLLSAPVGITPLKTPGKPPRSAPVEMTPLSKIINEETRLGKCTLLTPTIPPTPDYEVLKNQEQPAGDADISPSSNVNKKTPRSTSTPTSAVKTPSPPKNLSKTPKTPTPTSAVETPSPPKKLSKTPKTPVVKLRRKPAENTPKTRKRKPTKESKETGANELDSLIDMCVQAAEEQMFGSEENPQNNITRGPAKEVVQKKVTPKPKRKVPQKPKAKPKKQSKTDEKLSSFAEILGRYEKSTNGSSSSTECENVTTGTSPNPECVPANSPKIPKKKRKDAKKSPKKKSQKKKKIDKTPDSKTKSKKSNKKKVLEENSAESTTKTGMADGKNSEKSSTNDEGNLSTPDVCRESGTPIMKPLKNTLTLDVNSKIVPEFSKTSPTSVETMGQVKKASSTVTCVSQSSQDKSIRSLKGRKNDQELAEDLAISSDSGKVNEQPAAESTVLPLTQANTVVRSTVHSNPSPPAEDKDNFGNKTRVDLDNFELQYNLDRGDSPRGCKLRVTPYFSLFTYPLPPQKKVVSPAKLSNVNDRNVEILVMEQETQRKSSSCSRSKEDVLSRERVHLSNYCENRREDAAKTSTRRPSIPRSRSSSAEGKSSHEQKSTNVRYIKAKAVEEKSKRRRVRSRSSEDDKSPLKWSKDESFEAGKRRRRRSTSCSSNEDDKSPRRRKPVKSSNDSKQKVEEIVEIGKRRRRNSSCSSSTEDDRSSRKRRKIDGRRDLVWPKHDRQSGRYFRARGRHRGGRGYPRSSYMRSLRRSRRYSSSDDERERRKSRVKSLRYSGSRERDQSRSNSRDNEEGRTGKYHDDPNKHPSHSKRHHDDSRKHHDASHTHHDDSRKHQDVSKTHQDDSSNRHDDSKKHHSDSTRDTLKCRYQEPTIDQDSKKADRREAVVKPTCIDQVRHPNSIGQPSQIERRAENSGNNAVKPPPKPSRVTFEELEDGEISAENSGNNAVKPPPKPSRVTFEELEDGEISEESRNTIFQFSKNNPQSTAGGSTDRLSSPVANESRQKKLLKNVNVDKFLSIVHGDAKSPPAKEESTSTILQNHEKS